MPTKALDFDEYFTAFPRIPPNLPQSLTTFLSRVVVPIEQERATVSVSLALEETQQQGFVSVLLDIDVARETPNLSGSSEIWTTLDSFRSLKNKAFFGSLTEKAVKELE